MAPYGRLLLAPAEDLQPQQQATDIEFTNQILKQDGIHCQRPHAPPPMAFSVPNRNALYLRETNI